MSCVPRPTRSTAALLVEPERGCDLTPVERSYGLIVMDGEKGAGREAGQGLAREPNAVSVPGRDTLKGAGMRERAALEQVKHVAALAYGELLGVVELTG